MALIGNTISKRSDLIIKPVGDLVADDKTDGTIVEVLRSLRVEEDSLQDSSREFCTKANNSVQCSVEQNNATTNEG
jgi:hypothetical protein